MPEQCANDCPYKELLEEKINSVRDSMTKSEQVLDNRLNSMNEFREALRDQSSKMMTRDEYFQAHKNLEDKLRKLELDNAERSGETRTIAVLSGAVSSIIVGVVTAIILHFAFH